MRAVLAVVLVSALLAVAMPAVEDAGAERTARSVSGDLRSLGRAAQSLADGESAVAPGEAGARRTTTVDVPGPSWTSAGVDYVAIGGPPPGESADLSTRDGPQSDVLLVHVEGHGRLVVPVETDLRTGSANAPDDRALVLRSAGTHRIRLRLVVTDDGPVVVADRQRGFIREGAAIAGHAGDHRTVPKGAGRLPV